MIVSVSDVPREGVQILLGHQKQQSPPFGACPKCLKCLVTKRSTLPYIPLETKQGLWVQILIGQKATGWNWVLYIKTTIQGAMTCYKTKLVVKN
jgi:hypothetical protein